MKRSQNVGKGPGRMKREYGSIEEYIRTYPEDFQKKLIQLKDLVRKLAPDAQARISYQMPAFFLKRNLVYFAAHSKHIGFYPGAGVIRAFKTRLSKYKNAKGSVQFPVDEPLPVELIGKMIKFKVEEIRKKG